MTAYDSAFFDSGIDRDGTRTVKWKDGRGVLPMWVADMDFACAREITDAIEKRAAHACYGYTMDMADDRDALRAFLARRHGVRVENDQIGFLPCVVTGLRVCVNALTAPGDAVAVLTPVYGPFYASVRDAGRRVIACPMQKDDAGRYSPDMERVEDAMRGGAKLLMLCNPHNPVSRAFSADELEALCALAARYGARVVSDEIHMDFTYAPARFVSALNVKAARDTAVALGAPSKTFNLAGLQQAHFITRDPEAMKKIEREILQSGVTCGNIFGLEAARAAYEQGDAWLDGLLLYLQKGAQLLTNLIKERLPKAAVTPIEATYLAWVDLRAYYETTQQALDACFARGLALSPGTFFGPEGEGFVRVNFACPHDAIREGVRRLAP